MAETVKPYEATRKLADGGMGIVKLSRHKFLDRTVAIKEISAESLADPELAQRFDREAKCAASLNHPNIVAIYDYWKTAKTKQIVMEYVDGTTLRGLLKHSHILPPQISACIIYHIAEALAYVHKKGLVHRDIKPSNILISKDGEVKLSDFGIVKNTLTPSDLTLTGTQVGTPTYMSPEQIEGKKELDASSDIFSLGIVFYEILAGVHPFHAHSSEASAVNISKGRYVKIKTVNHSVPVTLSRIIKKCLKVNQRSRYKNASFFLKTLRWYLWKYDLSYSNLIIKNFIEKYTPDEDRTVIKKAEKTLESLPKSKLWKFSVFSAVLFFISVFIGSYFLLF